MQKNILGIGALLALSIALIFMFTGAMGEKEVPASVPPPQTTSKTSTPENATYTINDTPRTLVDGKLVRETAIGSVSKDTFMVFGSPVYGDLDADGDEDAALFLSQSSGGSGTFYYVALAMNDGGVYKGTNAMLLGDRIAPQTLEIHDGRAVANFAERKAGEPFTTQPSMGKSVWIHLDPNTGEIGEWVKDFEGEADPSRMSLGMHKWNWIYSDINGKKVTPQKPDVFGISFLSDGTFSVSTDCNRMGGQYAVNGEKLIFSAMMMTEMYCEGSQEGDFASALQGASSYKFTSRGELILILKDAGTMTFRGK